MPIICFTGNPNLKPSNNYALSLSYFKGFKKFVLNAEVAYSYNKDAIVPVLQSDDTNIIETFGNLDNAQNMKASLFLQWYPFSNNILRLRLYSEVFHQINAFGNEKMESYRTLFHPIHKFSLQKMGRFRYSIRLKRNLL